jgi:hypothetical protein
LPGANWAGPSFYQDVRVLAFPVGPDMPLPRPVLADGAGKALNAACADGVGVCDVTLTSALGKDAPRSTLITGGW